MVISSFRTYCTYCIVLRTSGLCNDVSSGRNGGSPLKTAGRAGVFNV